MLKRKTSLKRTPLKRKPVSKEVIDERKAQSEEDWAFYNKIWANRSHVCEVHDGYKFLGYTIKKYFFDHLLEKSKYPQLRHVDENIALVCFECHGAKTNCKPTNKHKKLIEQAKQNLLNNEH